METPFITSSVNGEVKIHDTWVSSESDTQISLTTSELSQPHITDRLGVNVFYTDQNEVSLDISRSIWTYLAGCWSPSNYQTFDLLDHRFTLDEIRLLADTLNAFVSGVESDEITHRNN